MSDWPESDPHVEEAIDAVVRRYRAALTRLDRDNPTAPATPGTEHGSMTEDQA